METYTIFTTYKKWYKINVVKINTQEEYDEGIAELKGYLAEIHEKYGITMNINNEEDKKGVECFV